MRDLLLVEGDLSIANGDLETVDNNDAIKQAIELTITLFKGEWFLDADTGLPYFEDILVKSPNLVAIRETFRKKLLNVIGVTKVTRLVLSLENSTRTLSVDWAVTTGTAELSGVFTA